MHKRLIVVLTFFIAVMLPAQDSFSRELSGRQNGKDIRIITEKLPRGEYARAAGLIRYFQPRWNYDAITGAITLVRPDGTKVSMMIGAQRLVIGSKVYPLDKPPIRHQQDVYIPLVLIINYMFPDVNFSETDPNKTILDMDDIVISSKPDPTPTPLIGIDPTDYTDLTTPFQPLPLNDSHRAVIVINPAHGGSETGTKSQTGIRESDITSGIAQKLSRTLSQSNLFDIVLIQPDSENALLTTDQRVGISNRKQGSLFISLECGGLFNPDISWAGTYFMNAVLDRPLRPNVPVTQGIQSPLWHNAYISHIGQSRQLAVLVHNRLNAYYQLQNIIQMNSNPRPARLTILRGLDMPAMVVELGNIHHLQTANHLSSERAQDDIAQEIAMAVNQFLYANLGMTQTNR